MQLLCGGGGRGQEGLGRSGEALARGLAAPPGTPRPQHGTLEPEAEEQLRIDLLDLALIWADLLRGLAGGKAGPEESLRLLQETQELFGESQVLCRLRQACAVATGNLLEADAAWVAAWRS